MKTHKASRWTGTVLALAACAASPAAAQEARLGMSAGWTLDPAGTPRRSISLTPSLGLGGAGWSASLLGQGSVLEGGTMLGAVAADARGVLLSAGPLALAAEGGVSGLAAGGGIRLGQGWASPRLRVSGAGWGVEAGPYAAAAASWRESSVPTSRLFGAMRGPDRTTGDWDHRTAAGPAASAWVGGEGIGLRADWRAPRSGDASWQDWSVGANARVGTVSLSLAVGERIGDDTERWAGAALEVPLSHSLSLGASAGRALSDPLTGMPGGTYGSVGLTLRSGGAPTTPAPVRPAPVVTQGTPLIIRERPGARVEVLGEWNDWQPQRLREIRPGEYELQASLDPGLHRFLLRVNGEWQVPEGFATEPDEYGGRRALLRVAER